MADKQVTLISSNKVMSVAADSPLHPHGIRYNATVLNGTLPGPVIGIDLADVLEIKFKNETNSIQSLIFNAGYGPTKAISGNVKPGESKTWKLVGNTSGAFLYYSGGDGLNGMWEHIANGLFGAVIVHSPYEKRAKEFCVVFSEIYNSADKGIFIGSEEKVGSFDLGKMYYGKSDLHLTNGMAHKYLPAIGAASQVPFNNEAEVFMVKPGELTRWYLVNAGPNEHVAFNFIGSISNVSDDPSKDSYGLTIRKDMPWSIPPGAGIVVETVFPEEGVYVGLDHNLTHFMKGAGFAVVASNDAKEDDHPSNSFVPPKGSKNPIVI